MSRGAGVIAAPALGVIVFSYQQGKPLDREVKMNTFVPHYTRPRANTIARDSRPRWAAKPVFDLDVAIKTLGNIMKAEGIQLADMLAVFPNRPTTEAECSAIAVWIGEQRAARRIKGASSAQAKAVAVADGYFAIPADALGFVKPHFFRVKTGKGRWAGTRFLTEQASDENYPVRGARKAQVMAWLAEHEDEARALYGTLISRCSRCNRTLTDHDNPYFPMYGPECGAK